MKTVSLQLNLRIFALFIIFLLAFSSGCRKEKVEIKPGEITSFKFEASKNSSNFSSDVVGAISGKEIKLNIPEGVNLENLVATFVFNGRSITVNGINQQSQVTVNNFEQPKVYVVTGNDNVPVSYTVKVVTNAERGLILTDFSILKVKNPSLSKDYAFIFNTKGDSALALFSPFISRTLIPSFSVSGGTVLINGQPVQPDAPVDFTNPVTLTVLSPTGFKRSYAIKINWAKEIPHIYINTTGGVPIVSKDDYVTATIRVDGKSVFDSYESTTRIKGRGNTTWNYPKKPYRLKLDNTVSLFGLAPEKDWVLLANYLDWTLMLNSLAMKAGSLINVPYANNIIPVELTLNNQYLGSYAFTEQVEVGTNRVNVGTGGLLLELDDYYDEPYKFRSANYNLPVMIKYPDLVAQTEVAPIKAVFEQMENLVAAANFPTNNYSDYIDVDSFARYFAVFHLTGNEELNHPKSIYMHRSVSGKFIMGPLWDFDWAYGYEGGGGAYFGNNYNRQFFWTPPKASQGTNFFSRFFLDPIVKSKYKQLWTNFRATKFQQLLKYIDDYAYFIENSQARDYALWKRGSGNFKNDVSALKTWLNNRAGYIDNYVSGF